MNKQDQSSATLLRYCVGIDVSKDSLQVCVSVIDTNGKIAIKGSGKINNKTTAFDSFLTWVDKHCKDKNLAIRFVAVRRRGGIHRGLSRAIGLVSIPKRFDCQCNFTKQG